MRFPAKTQKGLSFNGSTDYATIAAGAFSANDWNGAVSLALWVFLTRNTTTSPFLDNAWGSGNNVGGFQCYVNDGIITTNTYGTSTSSPDGVASTTRRWFGMWQHLVITKDISTTTQNLYINGELENSTTATSYGCNPPTTQLALGRAGNGETSGPFTRCQITDMLIWNRELTATEVTDAYYSQYPTSGLIHHWDFHEGSGDTVADRLGGPSFSVSGATWVDTYTAARTTT